MIKPAEMIAFVFPGQGSQKVGMGRALVEALPEAAACFSAADEALGFSLSRLCFEGPEAELQLTANTQPAILTASVAAFAAVERLAHLRPSFVAGHSLGEYSALVAAGALDFADAVRLVHQRGRFMQEAVPPGTGGMAALVGLPREVVDEICAAASGGETCQPANWNGASQVVIAGHVGAVERAVELAKQRGAKMAKALPVSAPFHGPLMQPAAERLAAALAHVEIRRPRVPVITNVEAAPTEDPARIRELLVRQVTAPVRWEESVQRLVELGVKQFVEVGPGRVHSGLIKRIGSGVGYGGVESPAEARALGEESRG